MAVRKTGTRRPATTKSKPKAKATEQTQPEQAQAEETPAKTTKRKPQSAPAARYALGGLRWPD